MRLLNCAILSAILTLLADPGYSHEFWIDPQSYQIQPGDRIVANLRVGEEFDGSSYPYRPSQIERFDLVQGDTVTEIVGRIGDNPALDLEASDPGLLIVVHETTDSRLTYREFAKFKKFVAHKDFKTALTDHEARGIGTEKFVELYRRYAKSLVAVGDGAGADRAVGLKTEIVALANPYTDAPSEMSVQVLLDGAPRADAQVELFDKSLDGTVKVSLHRTDADGVARFPMTAGHAYLADAVTLEALENDDPAEGPVWKTHWAALSFAVPAR